MPHEFDVDLRAVPDVFICVVHDEIFWYIPFEPVHHHQDVDHYLLAMDGDCGIAATAACEDRMVRRDRFPFVLQFVVPKHCLGERGIVNAKPSGVPEEQRFLGGTFHN